MSPSAKKKGFDPSTLDDPMFKHLYDNLVHLKQRLQLLRACAKQMQRSTMPLYASLDNMSDLFIESFGHDKEKRGEAEEYQEAIRSITSQAGSAVGIL